MSLSFCVLASGSSGNCTLVVCEWADGSPGAGRRHSMLIDAGLSPRQTARRLKPHGLRLHDLQAILLTHLDSDHFHGGWLRAIHKLDLPLRIHLHYQHRNAAWRTGLTARTAALFNGTVELDGCARVSSVLLAHDDLGSVGFLVEHEGMKLGYATDLGRVPSALFERFVDLDALAIESNYDRSMQVGSSRPVFLKRRIMGGNGHLSNDQCLAAVKHIDARSRLSHLALLHLSRECNDPDLVRRLYARLAPHLIDRLTVTCQKKPSPMLRIATRRPLIPTALPPVPTRPLATSGGQPQLLLFESKTVSWSHDPSAQAAGRAAG